VVVTAVPTPSTGGRTQKQSTMQATSAQTQHLPIQNSPPVTLSIGLITQTTHLTVTL